jgi:hypothetical protein
MPKKRKIGFDKLPGPVVESFIPLQDFITGEILRDDVGNPLVTEERGTLASAAQMDNSLPVLINTQSSQGISPINIAEIFPETSQVSSSLLGVPRAETQLSLFSDVSTYGLDSSNWDYYIFSLPIFYPSEWYTRENPIFGRRSRASFNEATDEQALYLKAYPVQYTYPYGPRDTRRYNEILFRNYLNFIAIGKMLYNYFSTVDNRKYKVFAENNFINDTIKIVNAQNEEVTDYSFDPNPTRLGTIIGSSSFYDVTYGDDLQSAFDAIERFTQSYNQIVGGIFSYPTTDSNVIFLDNSINAARDRVSPGYSFRGQYFGVLESKQTFRYQPGRISGFTFGVRSKNDTTTNENFIEWGCANDTDQYMFQIRGADFNIVRRSTIPLPESTLLRMGLSAADQTATPVRSQTLDNAQAMYELVIKRDQFNGDRLDFSGPSKYQVKFEKVTMFKIEFGWYGAIGAKFYAYVPVDHNEARWVLIHTLVIENGIGQPCLQNPDFKFRYTLSIINTANMLEPMYIYKYGSSYYIDGADEGTVYMQSTASEVIDFSANTPVLTLHTKKSNNNRDGIAVLNRKKVYPTSISINSSQITKVDIKEIISSPDGFHYFYAPSLQNGISPNTRTVELEISADRSEVTMLQNDAIFTEEDNDSKIIADGICNAYISYDDNETVAKIKRRNEYKLIDTQFFAEESTKTDGTVISLSNHVFTARLTNYNHTVVASQIPIVENNFKIHFLNPNSRDIRNFAEFAISITDKIPSMVDEQLKFNVDQADGGTDYDFSKELYVEWSQYEDQINVQGQEIGDWDPTYGIKLEIDPRLDRPTGVDSGRASVVIGKIFYDEYEYETANNLGNNQYELVFSTQSTAPSISQIDLDNNIDLGVNESSTGIIFKDLGTVFTDIVNGIGVEKFKITIEGDISILDNNNRKFQLKSVSLQDGWTVESFNINNTPRFTDKSFFISKKIRFNINQQYLVIGLKDRARINNIIVEEITPITRYAHTPKWITSFPDIIKFSGGSTMELSPASYQEISNSSGIRYDTQLLQPLRPGENISSFFVDQSDTSPINLSNIFERDRRTLTPGIYNNRVLVFSADRVGDSPSGKIELGISIKEQ